MKLRSKTTVSLARVLRYTWTLRSHYTPRVLGFLFLNLAASQVSLLSGLYAVYSGKLFLDYALPMASYRLFSFLLAINLLLFSMNYLSRLVLDYLSSLLSLRMTLSLQKQYCGALFGLNYNYHVTTSTGERIVRIQGDASQISSYLLSTLPSIPSTLVRLLVIVPLIFLLDYRILLAAFGVLVLLSVANYIQSLIKVQLQETEIDYSQRIAQSVQDIFRNFLHFKVRGHEQAVKTLMVSNRINDFRLMVLNNRRRQVLSDGIRFLNWGILTLLPTLALGGLLLSGHLTLGSVLFLMGLFGMLAGAVSSLSKAVTSLLNSGVYLKRFFDVVNSPDREALQPSWKTRPPVRDSLELRDVHFRYHESGQQVLKGCTWVLRPGRLTALMGRNGSGKSTLLRLMMRVYEGESGDIVLDGVDIRQYAVARWRRSIGFLDQRNCVIDGSVRENLRLFNPDVTDEAMMCACHAMGLKDFVRTPTDLDRHVGESGGFISDGMGRRMNLARLYLGEYDILLLDEPFAGVYAEDFARILSLLQERFPRALFLITTHSRQVAEYCDEACFLEGGVIVPLDSVAEIVEFPDAEDSQSADAMRQPS